MQQLEWKTSCGCAKCRPALNYYLIASRPEDYEDDPQSRFINERVHANIQKDGTYSVVPRMWGGVTSAAELRAIADVVDKFAIPSVKVTGGQRIDLLGVKKEQLPAVWADLNKAGMISGAAYAKGLRTVKTCVGSEWCRFGTQDSTGLGINWRNSSGVRGRRQRSSWASPAVRAIARRRPARTLASSASTAATTSFSPAPPGSTYLGTQSLVPCRQRGRDD